MEIFRHRLENEAPRRSNLKWDCCFWTFLTFAGLLLFWIAYDFLARYSFDSANASKECFVRFSYVHVGALISFVGAVFAFLAIVVTAKVNETMNLHSFNLRYADEQMLAAVRLVGNVERRWNDLRKAGAASDASPFDTPPDTVLRSDKNNANRQILIANYGKFVTSDDCFKPWTEEEDGARRLVKNYFSSALELYRCGGISKKTLRVVCDTDAVTLLFNVIEPMEFIINKEYKFDVFYDLMKVLRDVYARKLKESKAHKLTSHFKV